MIKKYLNYCILLTCLLRFSTSCAYDNLGAAIQGNFENAINYDTTSLTLSQALNNQCSIWKANF